MQSVTKLIRILIGVILHAKDGSFLISSRSIQPHPPRPHTPKSSEVLFRRDKYPIFARRTLTTSHTFTHTISHPLRYFVRLSFDGSAYHGWQIQPNAVTVQQKLDESLTTLLRTPIQTVGAGRTDAGVNAHCMVAHFDHHAADGKELNTTDLTFKLNRILPRDIAVQRVIRVADDAHARFDARSRTYRYWVYREKSPFLRYYATRLNFPVDFELMNQAARLLLETRDFTSFSKLHTDVKTNICKVTQAQWTSVDGNLWQFEITADRFLRNMVRSVVGTLVDVGRGRISLEEFARVIQAKDRCAAGESMPGNALSLWDITYDFEI